ncbi:MAG: DEAD/DEAH box helicase family protein [Turicibacter sp.]|nr:DEAD/DEAH box helicase family protein [Turicibacter sp.]
MKRKKKNQKQQNFSEQLSLFSFGDLSFDSSNNAKVPLIDEGMTIEIEQESSIELQVLTFPEDVKVVYEDYQYDSSHDLIANGAKAKCRNNIKAIELLKEIEKEHRPATKEEQIILARYVGWGGLAEALTPDKAGWEKEYETLSKLLTPTELQKAQESTLTAFYTNHEIIQVLYHWLEKIGFKGGNILEPSMGIGNFFSCLPQSLSHSKLYGVELDSISGRIAKILHPNADIQIKGFEETDFDDHFFDLIVGNVPFGNLKINDPRYKRHHFSIHNYFIAKALDKLRPGGFLAVLTSKWTLDQQSIKVRKYIDERASLIGAIRFPNNAFKQIAGTEAVEDLLIFKKREHGKDENSIEKCWLYLSETDDGVPVNEYFLKNPTHLLGKMVFRRGLYNDKETTCEPIPNIAWMEQLEEVFEELSREVKYEESMFSYDEEQKGTDAISANLETRNFSYAIVDQKLYFREHSKMYPQNVVGTKYQRIKGLIEIHQCLRDLIDFQTHHKHGEIVDLTLFENQLQQKMKRLNKVYDNFIEKYDYINVKANRDVFKRDSSYPLLCSLENERMDEKGVYDKSAIFYKPTILQQDEPYMAESAFDAMLISLNIKGEIDLNYMAELYENFKEEPVSIVQLLNELGTHVFRDPKLIKKGDDFSGWVVAEDYLSGNVYEKLELAKEAAKEDSTFERNVIALKDAQPEPIQTHEISFILGSTWIPLEYYQQFMKETLGVSDYWEEHIFISYSKVTNNYNIDGKSILDHTVLASQTFGTRRMCAFNILEQSLNMKTVEVRDRVETADDKVKYILNQEETILAREKQTSIQLAFEKWLFEDSERAEYLTNLYNKIFNSYRFREYSGEHLTFPGMTADITLRKHQLNVIAQGIYSHENVLIAHEVGAGKTFSAIAIAKELKRLGSARKVLITVPNHLIGQWGKEFLTLYPTANILVATQNDFKKENRRQFISRILTGDYDAIIMGHSTFERINMSKEYQLKSLEYEIKAITNAITETKRESGKGWSLKQLTGFKKKLDSRYEALFNEPKKDDLINFEELGIDCLIVDEAHAFKNNFSYTKLQNVAGLSNTRSQRAVDMYMKVQYINQQNNGRGVYFLTGTPVSNSMSELHTMQKTLQPKTLEKMGMLAFDCWASTFGKVESSLEIRPEGNGYQLKNRFSKFHNLPELMQVFKQIADVKTEKMLDLPIPKLKTGQMQVITIPITDAQQDIVYSHAERAERIRGGSVSPEEDNFLKLTSEAKLNSIDPRILDDTIEYDPNTKLCICAKNVAEIFHETTSKKLTQLVFCDKGTPKNDKRFTFYQALKDELINLHVPEEQIVFIHDCKTDAQRLALFEKVNDGDVRILIGSTEKMGTGMNVQRRLIAIHHLDIPWRPADLTQRNGRILRQGNMNEEVSIFNYITENTFDAYLWQILEQKQRYISQIMTEKAPMRSFEDVDTTQLQYAQFKALAVADDRIKHKMEIENEIHRLTILRNSWQNQRHSLYRKLKEKFPEQVKNLQNKIEHISNDLSCFDFYKETPFELIVNGEVLTEKEAIIEAINNARKVIGFKIGDMTSIGTLFGFKLDLIRKAEGLEFSLRNHHIYETKVGVRPEYYISRIENIFKKIPDIKVKAEEQLQHTYLEIEAAEKEVKTPFMHDEELNSLRLEKARLDAELGIN